MNYTTSAAETSVSVADIENAMREIALLRNGLPRKNPWVSKFALLGLMAYMPSYERTPNDGLAASLFGYPLISRGSFFVLFIRCQYCGISGGGVGAYDTCRKCGAPIG